MFQSDVWVVRLSGKMVFLWIGQLVKLCFSESKGSQMSVEHWCAEPSGADIYLSDCVSVGIFELYPMCFSGEGDFLSEVK